MNTGPVPTTPTRRRLFPRGSWPRVRRVADVLRTETVGGVLLVSAAAAALLFANSPWRDAYTALAGFTVGPAALHLDLSLATWAADGLLAVFFFVVGLELKREFLAGDLRDPRTALLPVAAAVGGMAVPALIYVAINLANPDALVGWAIPTATDIAFALAVLAVIGTHLPTALRTFLLTLAVVDDLLAITVIAVFYTDRLSVAALLGALVPLALFTLAVQRGVRSWWVLLPLAALTWVLVHASGVHATVAGVLLGFAVPVLGRRRVHGVSLSEHFEHRWRPLSAGFAVPVFAFFAAGVTVVGGNGSGDGGGGASVPPWPTPSPSGSSRGWWSGRPWACSARPGWCSGAPGPSCPTTCPGGTCSASPSWPGSGSPCRCSWGSWPSAPAHRRTTT